MWIGSGWLGLTVAGLLFLQLSPTLAADLAALPMIGLVMLGYGGAWLAARRIRPGSSIQQLGLTFFYVTVAFVCVLAALAIFRWYYSRSFLGLTYLFTGGWLLVGTVLRAAHQRLAVVPGGLAAIVQGVRPGTHDWTALEASGFQPPPAALVADLQHRHPSELVRSMVAQSLRGVPIIDAMTLHEHLTGRVVLHYVRPDSLERFSEERLYDGVKRVLDFLAVALTLPLWLPVSLLVALAIKLDSPGPVLFRQRRIGLGGVPFEMVKFRSMVQDAEREGASFTRPDDARITRIGHLLRTYRLDELPQFWNVVRGEMSLIGPRPEQVGFSRAFEDHIPYYAYRHRVRPGITGWAQVRVGYTANDEETAAKLEHDLYYAKHRSLSLDAVVLYETIRTVLTGFGSR